MAGGYVVTGITGNLVSSGWAHLHGARLLSAGASGGLMGLLGMVAVLAWMADLKPLAKSLLRNAMFIIGIGLALSWSGQGALDNGAHIGGLLSGMAIGWIRTRIRRPLSPSLSFTLSGASLVATLTSFTMVVLRRGAS